jgi:hypothetical protein
VYLSTPYFKDTMHGQPLTTNEGQSAAVRKVLKKHFFGDGDAGSIKGKPEDGAGRIHITRCTKSPECGAGPEVTDVAVYTDIVTGSLIKASQALQPNVRIMSGSKVFPKFKDAMVPMYILRQHGDIANDKDAQKSLADLQKVPEAFAGLAGLFVILGALAMVIGILTCVCAGCMKKRESNQVEKM